jgi:hypothetical protein
VIADGTYDVFVVDALPIEPMASDTGGWHLELTILGGDNKGDVVSVHATGLRGNEFDLIGMPGTLVVADGQPTFRIDD